MNDFIFSKNLFPDLYFKQPKTLSNDVTLAMICCKKNENSFFVICCYIKSVIQNGQKFLALLTSFSHFIFIYPERVYIEHHFMSSRLVKKVLKNFASSEIIQALRSALVKTAEF